MIRKQRVNMMDGSTVGRWTARVWYELTRAMEAVFGARAYSFLGSWLLWAAVVKMHRLVVLGTVSVRALVPFAARAWPSTCVSNTPGAWFVPPEAT